MWQCVILLICYLYALGSAQIVPREANSCESRQTPGPICESCDLLSTCVRHSNGWINIPVESCDVENGYYCNSRLGMCSNATGPCHPFGIEGNFQCTSQGMYPDPYDCQKYHLCYFVGATLVAASVNCVSDKAFDAATGQCSLNLQSNACLQRQYECPSVGYVSAWKSNPNIFYVCKSTVKENQNDVALLYPSLHRCGDAEIFVNFYCRNASDANLPPDVTNGPNTNMNGTTIAPGPQQRCQKVGLSADPQDCHKYYFCPAINGTMRRLECPPGTFYSAQFSACKMGNC